MSNKRKYINNPYAGKKRKAWNKPTKLFPSKWKRDFAKSNKGSYYNQGKWINEYEYGKGRCNEYYDDYLDLETTDESSCSGESEAKSHNGSVTHYELEKSSAFSWAQPGTNASLV